jgi:hypothetical protein
MRKLIETVLTVAKDNAPEKDSSLIKLDRPAPSRGGSSQARGGGGPASSDGGCC